MIISEQVLQAQRDPKARESLIEAHLQDICRYASKAAGRWIDRHDDAYSEALIAFNDAITAFDPNKGPFPTFAARVIKNRITDQYRKVGSDGTLPFSDLETVNGAGETVPFDLQDPRTTSEELFVEILSLRQELEAFQISFYRLPAVSPKAGKTRRACIAVVRQLQQDAQLLDKLLTTGRLPAKQLTEKLKISGKVLERHRDYIIAGALICCGGYYGLASYFLGGEPL